MPTRNIALLLIASTLSSAQRAGHQKPEYHLPLPIEQCTSDGCAAVPSKVVLDSNWRWTHKAGDYHNCFTGSTWNPSFCPTAEACTANCALDGVPQNTWQDTYGVSSSDGALKLSYVTGANVGSRTYLMADDDHYFLFKLKNKEFAFDIDVSTLPCGLNGAMYLVEMAADGGKAEFPTNEAGARYGTGYCDAQCPHDMKWISGEANLPWNGTTDSGKYGTCCAEMDLWEGNSVSTQLTVHGCSTEGPHRCDGVECGDNDKGQRYMGVCDKDGCDYNPYRVGARQFYGPGGGFALDTSKPLTVVTQFLTDDGTDDGTLVEVRRHYIQDGKRVSNPSASAEYGSYDSISDKQCAAQKKAFGEFDDFTPKGGLKAMGEAMERGMVLVLSLWDDASDHMIWLDATDPPPEQGQPPKKGAPRGTCSVASGDPAATRKAHPHAQVTFGKIRFGALNTTAGPPLPPSPPAPPSGCPGGTLAACMGLCPASPPAAYQACAAECAKRCAHKQKMKVAELEDVNARLEAGRQWQATAMKVKGLGGV